MNALPDCCSVLLLLVISSPFNNTVAGNFAQVTVTRETDIFGVCIKDFPGIVEDHVTGIGVSIRDRLLLLALAEDLLGLFLLRDIQQDAREHQFISVNDRVRDPRNQMVSTGWPGKPALEHPPLSCPYSILH